jgi:hypothetical protein
MSRDDISVTDLLARSSVRVEEVTITGATLVRVLAFPPTDQTIFVPEGFTEIGKLAFANIGPMHVVVPPTVEIVHEAACLGAPNLRTFTFANGAKPVEFGASVFDECEQLSNVDLGSRPVARFGRGCFRNTAIEAFDAKCPGIPDGMFYMCEKLQKVTVRATDESARFIVGADACFGCLSLRYVDLPANTTRVGTRAFALCKNLTEAPLSSGLDSLGEDAFRFCLNLHGTVTIPEGVKKVPKRSFAGCGRILAVVCPQDANEVHPTAVDGCPNLRALVAPELPNLPPPWQGVPDCQWPNAVRAAEKLHYWTPETHQLCNTERRAWVRYVCLFLTKSAGLPHVVVVVVLRHIAKNALGTMVGGYGAFDNPWIVL